MSLDSLRSLRRSGRKPEHVVTVLIGPVPAWRQDDPAFVAVKPDALVDLMDWRPVVGLWVALFVTADPGGLAGRVMDALTAAGAKFYGAALPDGTFPCIADPTEKHHANLRRKWELLCN